MQVHWYSLSALFTQHNDQVSDVTMFPYIKVQLSKALCVVNVGGLHLDVHELAPVDLQGGVAVAEHVQGVAGLVDEEVEGVAEKKPSTSK